MSNTFILAIAAVAVFTASTIRAEEKGHEGHDHTAKVAEKGHEGHDHAKGEHGAKKVLTIKGVGTIELVHDQKDGEVTLTILGVDKKALKPAKAPRLNLTVDGKRKQVKTKAVGTVKAGNVFTAVAAVLTDKLNGQVTIKIGDKNHKVDINPHLCADGHDHSAH